MATCCSCGKSGEAMYFICEDCAAQKAATNGDRIRGMSDEELAGLLACTDFCEVCEYERDDGCCRAMETDMPRSLSSYCAEGALRWIKQRVKDR